MTTTEVVEWLTCRSRAVSIRREAESPAAALTRQARILHKHIHRVLSSSDPFPRRADIATTLLLARQALHLAALSARHDGGNEPSLAECLATDGVREVLSVAAGAPENLQRLEKLLVEPGITELSQRARPRAESDAREVERILRGMLDRLPNPDAKLVRIQVRRSLLALAVAATVVVGIFAGTALYTRVKEGPDLASATQYRTSSQWKGFSDKSRTVLGFKSGIFFHTEEEQMPWIEYDLGKTTSVHFVRVVNRIECCRDRAVPLVVEVSNDAKSWRSVARRDSRFRTWKARFPATEARYVRLRVAAKSTLHLEQVEIR